jgi:hypothetical protein
MDAFQIISITLLSLIVVALSVGLVIGYKSAVRRDVAAKNLQMAVEDLTLRIKEGHTAIQAVGASTNERLNSMTEEVKELRRQFDEAIHF